MRFSIAVSIIAERSKFFKRDFGRCLDHQHPLVRKMAAETITKLLLPVDLPSDEKGERKSSFSEEVSSFILF